MAFDRHLIQALRTGANPAVPIGPHWLPQAMVDMTAFGSTTGLVLLTALVAGYLLSTRRVRAAAFIVAATGSGAILGMLLKLIFSRPRPELVPHLVKVSSSSFPSGHAADAAIVYLTLAALLARTERSLRTRLYIVAAAIFLTLAIGGSRIFLGVHWPSDVIAGWMVGSAWALFSSLYYDWLVVPMPARGRRWACD